MTRFHLKHLRNRIAMHLKFLEFQDKSLLYPISNTASQLDEESGGPQTELSVSSEGEHMAFQKPQEDAIS